MNLKCKVEGCGNVYGNKRQAIVSHLVKTHKIIDEADREKLIEETDEPITPQPWHASPSSRPKYLGGQTTNWKCLHCPKVFEVKRSVLSHMRGHKLDHRTTEGVDYKATKDAVTERRQFPYYKKGKRGGVIVTPQTSFVDIPVILRIPLTIGQVSMLHIAEIERR